MSAFSRSYFSFYSENVLKKIRKMLHFNGEFPRPVTGYKAGSSASQPWSRHPLSASPLEPRPGSPSSSVFSSVKRATVIPESPDRNLGVPSQHFPHSPRQPIGNQTPWILLPQIQALYSSSLTMSAALINDNLQFSILVPFSLASISPYAYMYLNHHFRMKMGCLHPG